MDNCTDNLVTIITFTFPSELVIIRSRLESEGIECFVQNELTAQVQPFYSNAIGGIKLQVKEEDVAKAIEILKEGGYLKDENLNTSKLPAILYKYTSMLPFLKKQKIEVRLFVIIAILVTLAVSTFYFITLPSTSEKLTKNRWCLNLVEYSGKTYMPETNDQILELFNQGNCPENISFEKNGTVLLPGFKSNKIYGKWVVEKGKLRISNTDNFDYLYNGIYAIDFSDGELNLISDKTSLHCKVQYTNYHF